MLFGLYVRREALWAGFFADDYAQLGMLDGTYPVQRAPYNLFSFSDGSKAEGARLMHAGFYPWWADPQVRLVMLRPLASLMIWCDYKLFGSDPFGYHVHSALWWFVMLATIAALFWRVLPVPQALVAFALLVCDEAHGVALAWICNRSALVSTSFSVIALLCYRHFRSSTASGGARWLAAAMLSYSVALAFGEYAICALGYLAAYELCCGTGTRRERLRAFVPMLAPPLVFLCVRSLLGCTVQRSGVYVDPIDEPVSFVTAVIMRMPVLMSDLVLAVRADYWTFGSPWTHSWLRRGWVSQRWVFSPEPWRLVHFGIGIVACMLVALLARNTLRRESQRSARWLLLGSVLSVVPVSASFPSSRLLLVPLIGFVPLLAAFIVAGFQRFRAFLQSRRWRALVYALVALAVAVYHVVMPVSTQRDEVAGLRDGTVNVRDAILSMDVDETHFAHQDLILLAALEGGTSMYLPATRLRYGHPAPRSCLFLSYVTAPYVLSRTARNAFTMRFSGIHTMLATSGEHLLRSPNHPFRVADSVDVGSMRVTIVELFDGRPRRILVEFDRPLEDPSLLFMVPRPDGYQRFALPPIGESVVVPAPAVPTVDVARRQTSRS